ncbi:MAG: signal peptidase I [Candidatus Bathyarchaeia archaeon]
MRPESSTILPLISGVIGTASCMLLYFGLSNLIELARSKPKTGGTLVLRRGENGRVVSIGRAEAGYVTKARAPAANKDKPIGEAPRVRRHGKAKHVIGVAVLAALVLGGYASTMAVTGYTVQDAVRGMYSPFMAVSSGSMQPVLNYGDLIIVRREAAEGIVVGDIIVFNVPSPYDRLASSPTVHRVVEELVVDGETLFKTKGDSNPGGDPWSVSAENVIGKYAGKVPYLGSAVLFLRGPIGLTSITALIALSFLYPYFKKRLGGGANP